jgi:ketosteroid isomerase-like protein
MTSLQFCGALKKLPSNIISFLCITSITKITAKSKLLFAILFFTLLSSPLFAQIGAELETAVSNFQTAYNEGNDAALGNMFTSNAVRINTDGTTITGAEKIKQAYKSGFTMSTLQTTNAVSNVTFVNANEATVTGTYSITGNIRSNGEEVFSDGTFENTFIKDNNGVWKISRMLLKDNQ